MDQHEDGREVIARHAAAMIPILQDEIRTIDNILNNKPGWLNHPGMLERTKARRDALKEQLAEHQKDVVTFRKKK